MSAAMLTLMVWFHHVLQNKHFSFMNIVKIRPCNKMEDDLLIKYLVIYIKEKIAENVSTKMLMDDLYS